MLHCVVVVTMMLHGVVMAHCGGLGSRRTAGQKDGGHDERCEPAKQAVEAHVGFSFGVVGDVGPAPDRTGQSSSEPLRVPYRRLRVPELRPGPCKGPETSCWQDWF
jgi:hypothetical protein